MSSLLRSSNQSQPVKWLLARRELDTLMSVAGSGQSFLGLFLAQGRSAFGIPQAIGNKSGPTRVLRRALLGDANALRAAPWKTDNLSNYIQLVLQAHVEQKRKEGKRRKSEGHSTRGKALGILSSRY
jgi:hypothetical protein